MSMFELASELRGCFPSDSFEQLHSKFVRAVGYRISEGMTRAVISYVRANYLECGYTIPRAKMGRPQEGERRRWWAVPVERDGTFQLDDVYRDRFVEGTRSGVAHITQQLVNIKNIIATLKKYTRPGRYHEWLDDLEDHMGFMSRRMTRVLQQFNRDAA